ncbi:MAG TPA: hypothetical protein VGS07_29150 [Thermoanaerobaculia bacterium]|nr:hypothetical protein [Thermoanaerobaculia bacterium]
MKEGLVERVRQWPGVHSASALIDGTPLTGHWFDRTREFAARNQREQRKIRSTVPPLLARSPAPLVHAATKAVRKAFYDAYAWFVAAFRDAAERLRLGTAPHPSPPAASRPLCHSSRAK